MKLSTEIASISRVVGEEKAVEYVAKAGFDAWDFSLFSMAGYNWGTKTYIKSDHILAGDNYLSFAKKLKKIGLDNGIVCNQSHAPFPICCKEIYSYLKRAIECTAEAGGEYVIIHPENDSTPEENAEIFFELLPFAKEHGVKIATENMFNWDNEEQIGNFAACATAESFLAHLNAVNDPYLVACLDIGHAEMKGTDSNAYDMIISLDKHLKALHIHDNDLRHDSHQIPFSMSIDFEKVAKALNEINYDGYLTLEADQYMKKFNKDNAFQGVKDLYASAKRLSDMMGR